MVDAESRVQRKADNGHWQGQTIGMPPIEHYNGIYQNLGMWYGPIQTLLLLLNISSGTSQLASDLSSKSLSEITSPQISPLPSQSSRTIAISTMEGCVCDGASRPSKLSPQHLSPVADPMNLQHFQRESVTVHPDMSNLVIKSPYNDPRTSFRATKFATYRVRN